MKLYKFLAIAAIGVILSSCGEDFLTAHATHQGEAGAEATEGAILSYLTAAYQPLLMDSYADFNYNHILLLSDLRSDDIYTGGGDAGDQSWMYHMSLFQIPAAESPAGIWRLYYTAIARANNTLLSIDNAVGFDSDAAKQRLAGYKAEALFLRAYYLHHLWKLFGNIPFFTEPLADPYMAHQKSADEIYADIMTDIAEAEAAAAQAGSEFPMSTNASAKQARVSLGALYMLKARVVMYQNDKARYSEVAADMAKIINSGAYGLIDFNGLWTGEDANDFTHESIFETNQISDGKRDWGNAWSGCGTNLPAFISPNELSDPVFCGGWGFGPVRQSTWDMYEEGDVRREGSIIKYEPGTYNPRYQNTGLFQKKYAARTALRSAIGTVDLNYPNNLIIFRYAETLLNYAELVGCLGASDAGVSAQACLDQVRSRAGLGSIPVNMDNIKSERRKEFVGEGMRFWDLIRWGDAQSVLSENDEAFQSVRSFNPQKDKYLPIPQSEMSRTAGTGEFELKQNNGY
ncbi:MAG: RagB/SusD family nutrient uptake outer membrane protein [Bacteroidales bacterium]|nr:RagB/SusD family nutrient uptake outer membrane protein [Bacteroidales bacterium]